VPGTDAEARIKRAFSLAARAMQSRFGASGAEKDIEAVLSDLFTPILNEKDGEISSLNIALETP
jgi:hypothetical protein